MSSDDEDFDELDDPETFLPQLDDYDLLGYPIDIEPMTIIKNLPNYEDGYYIVDELDVRYAKDNIELDFTEVKWKKNIEEIARQERIKQDQITQEMLRNNPKMDEEERIKWERKRNRTKDNEAWIEMQKKQELQYEENQYLKML